MSATDRLRLLLDECGMDWLPDVYHKDTDTVWRVGRFEWRASEREDGKLLIGCMSLWNLPPAKAVEVSIGKTCHNVAPEYLDYLCSECGFVHYHSDENDDGDGNDWEYCPRCGSKVVR